MDGALTDIRSPILRQALAYWNDKRGARAMPARADIDPMEIIQILPHVILLDVLREPLDFRYRLIGTVNEEHMSEPYTGRRFSELPHQCAPSRIWSCSERVVRDKHPLRSDIPYVGPKRDFTSVEDIMMPLAADGATVDMIFVVIEYVQKRAEVAASLDTPATIFG
ncbi:MAG: PAS domain-containing protein [Alphaproteobacteria bacterium]|nr:PAS domain-containing protein [Alphaproteobacteria bacterium]